MKAIHNPNTGGNAINIPNLFFSELSLNNVFVHMHHGLVLRMWFSLLLFSFFTRLSNFPPSYLSIPFWDTPNLFSQFKETKQFGKNGITLWFHLHSSLLVRMTFFILFFHLFIGHRNYYVKTYSPGIFVSLNWKR